MHRLGKTVVFDGVTYERGSYIDHDTAVAMILAGVIKATIR
jgi:hypothetical protein